MVTSVGGRVRKQRRLIRLWADRGSSAPAAGKTVLGLKRLGPLALLTLLGGVVPLLAVAARGASSAATDVNINDKEKRRAIFAICAAAICNMNCTGAMRQEFGRVEQLRSREQLCDSDRVFFVAPRLIAYRPALGPIVDAPGRLGVCFESALSWLGHLLAWQKRIKAAPPAASTQPSARTKRQPQQTGCPGTSHGAPPPRGSPPHGHSARGLRSMHEIPGRDLGEPQQVPMQSNVGGGARLR